MARQRIDLSKITTIPLNVRKCKVSISDFARTGRKGGSFKDFYDSLPQILVAQDLRALVDAVVAAHKKKKMVIRLYIVE